MIRIELPYPPTTNNLFRNAGKSRVKTLAYNSWIKLASTQIKDRHRANMGAYSIPIALKRPDNRRRDIANCEKAISDLLVAHGVVRDDSLCQRLVMTWDNAIDADCVVVVRPADDGDAAPLFQVTA